jgi:translation elongation factor EF-4
MRKQPGKQKAGKKKMRQFGKVEIPQDASIAALTMDGDFVYLFDQLA